MFYHTVLFLLSLVGRTVDTVIFTLIEIASDEFFNTSYTVSCPAAHNAYNISGISMERKSVVASAYACLCCCCCCNACKLCLTCVCYHALIFMMWWWWIGVNNIVLTVRYLVIIFHFISKLCNELESNKHGIVIWDKRCIWRVVLMFTSSSPVLSIFAMDANIPVKQCLLRMLDMILNIWIRVQQR